MKRPLIFAGLAILLSLPWTGSAEESPARQGQDFVQGYIREAIRVRTDKSLPSDQMEQRTGAMLHAYYAFPGLPRAMLGRYWDKASPEQRDRYLALFEEYLLVGYDAAFGAISDQIAVQGTKLKDGRLIVYGRDLSDPTGDSKIEWTMARSGEGAWRIADMAIDGVSGFESMRADFAALLRANGGNVEVLLTGLQRQIKSLRANPPTP